LIIHRNKDCTVFLDCQSVDSEPTCRLFTKFKTVVYTLLKCSVGFKNPWISVMTHRDYLSIVYFLVVRVLKIKNCVFLKSSCLLKLLIHFLALLESTAVWFAHLNAPNTVIIYSKSSSIVSKTRSRITLILNFRTVPSFFNIFNANFELFDLCISTRKLDRLRKT
jgi:hypothetical protein